MRLVLRQIFSELAQTVLPSRWAPFTQRGGGIFELRNPMFHHAIEICLIGHSKGGMMITNVRRAILLLLFLAVTLSGAAAYQLSPLNVTYDPTGAGSAKVYTIVNDSDSPIAIEVRAVKRSIDIDGNEYNEDVPQYFSIQPNKMIIRPDSTQLVRVQYRGPSTVTKELSFRIISEQIPMPSGASEQEAGQMISFLFVYSTSAYVKPSRVVESVTGTASLNDEGKLEIVLENTGSVHQMLNSVSITVSGDSGGSYTLTEEELAPVSGQNLLTDSRLRTIIDVPEELADSTAYTVSLTYDFSY